MSKYDEYMELAIDDLNEFTVKCKIKDKYPSGIMTECFAQYVLQFLQMVNKKKHESETTNEEQEDDEAPEVEEVMTECLKSMIDAMETMQKCKKCKD